MMVAFYREIYDADMTDYGKIMKLVEVAATSLYFLLIIQAIFYFLSWNVNSDTFEAIMVSLELRNKERGPLWATRLGTEHALSI